MVNTSSVYTSLITFLNFFFNSMVSSAAKLNYKQSNSLVEERKISLRE